MNYGFLYGRNIHHLIPLKIWQKVFQVIGYGHLYSKYRESVT